MTRVFVGTSGFSYDEWRGTFYPTELRADGMLAYYAERLATVELNNTFYRTPTKEALERWAAAVPAGFRFAVKASRFLSHALAGDRAAAFEAFVRAVRGGLGDRLGPVMLQIPAPAGKDVARLRALVATLPAGAKVAIDFRNPTWLAKDTYDALRSGNVALVVTDDAERAGQLEVTADFAYVRLRRDAYGPARLARWAKELRAAGCSEAYVYFKHEGSTRGPELATKLEEQLSATGARRSASRRSTR